MPDTTCSLCGGAHAEGACPTVRRAGSADTLRPSAPAPEEAGLRAGSRFGRYEILAPVGRGGMGAVYRARDTELGREVALKVLLGGGAASADEIERFRREASAVASLAHPGIVPLFDSGTHEGRPFFCMEFVEGKSLDAVLKRERVGLEEALGIVRDVARALDYAHAHGVVHRDVKPGNVLLDGQRRPRLTDFGLARRVEGGSALTVSGEVLGTPQYMSPEQAGGRAREVDARSDVWSLGAIFYELLTLEPPHRGTTLVELLRRAADEDVVPVRRLAPRVPRDVETVCMKALERDRDRRYATAGEFADDIERVLRREAVRAAPPSVLYRVSRWTQRNPLPALLAALFVFVGIPAGTWQYRRPGTVTVRVKWEGKPFRPSEVRVGGRALEVFEGGARGAIPAGTHEVRVIAPGFEEGKDVVAVERGGVHEVAVVMRHERGVLDLDVEPEGAVVRIGNVDHGTPLRNFEIDTGDHDLLVRRRGYHDARIAWTARAGERRSGFASLPPAVVWSKRLRALDWAIRVIGDASGDGLPELIYSDGLAILCRDVAAQKDLWALGRGAVIPSPWETTDLDGDGVLDVVEFRPVNGEVVISAWSGRAPVSGTSPAKLWETTDRPEGAVGKLTHIARPALADVDGDGTPDVIGSSLWRDHVVCWSGRDGRRLWAAAVDGWSLAALPERDSGERLRIVVPAEDSIACLDGATGRQLWKTDEPVGRLAGTSRYLGETLVWFTGDRARWLLAADLDGMPGEEVVIPRWFEERRTIRLRAFSAEDGRILWEGPDQPGLQDLSNGASGDATGDGVPDFLVKLADKTPPTMALLDGRNGKTVWTRQTAGWLYLLSDAAGVQVVEVNPDSVVFLDPGRGTALSATPLPARPGGATTLADWDGDGRPEVLQSLADGTLLALRTDGTTAGSCLLEAGAQWVQSAGDVNGDGQPDLIARGQGPSLILGPRLLWSRRSDSTVIARPLPGDFDGDGAQEVAVFGQIEGEQGLYLLEARTGRVRVRGPGWGMRQPVAVPRPEGGADLLAVVFRGNDAKLQLSSGKDASVLRSREIPLTYMAPGLEDADGDGTREVLLATWSSGRRLIVLDGTTWEERWSWAAGNGSWMTPQVHELDGAAPPEVLCNFHDGILVALDGRTGAERWKRDLGGLLAGPTAVGDLDGDGTLEIVISGPKNPGSLLCLDGRNGKEKWAAADAGGSHVQPWIRDVDADGRPEVLAGTPQRGVVCLGADGAVRWSWAAPGARGGHVEGQFAAADTDGDGDEELLAAFGDGGLRALDLATGRPEWTFFTQDPQVEGASVAADVDGDGRAEILLAGNDRFVYCLRSLARRR